MQTDPVAIVTGASRGIGRALACGLAADGFRVAALVRSTESVRDLAAEAGVDPARILPAYIDLEKPATVDTAIRTVVQKWERIDVLVNNAGICPVGTLNVPFNTFESVLRVNLAGPFRILQEVVPIMLERKSGLILNVASRAGKIGFADNGVYVASKFGLVGLNESLYRELVPQGIKVTALCPAWVDTQMAQEAGTPLPGPEMIRPEDLMKTVRWLLSLSPAACVREVLIECRGNIA